ncbi:hypothetical protein B5F76_12955, partial [Desulfovibrio sp. An276]
LVAGENLHCAVLPAHAQNRWKMIGLDITDFYLFSNTEMAITHTYQRYLLFLLRLRPVIQATTG